MQLVRAMRVAEKSEDIILVGLQAKVISVFLQPACHSKLPDRSRLSVIYLTFPNTVRLRIHIEIDSEIGMTDISFIFPLVPLSPQTAQGTKGKPEWFSEAYSPELGLI